MPSDLVQAWQMNQEAGLFLLKQIPPRHLADRYSARTRTVAEQFGHVHAVRLRWLDVSAPKLAAAQQPLPKEPPPGKTALRTALVASARAIASFLEQCEATGKVPAWKGPPATFLGYLVAHEAHHRALVIQALRACDHRPNDAVIYGLWDWGKSHSRR